MTTLMQRCRVAGLAAAVLLAGTAAEVRAEEVGAAVPSEPTSPAVAPTPLPSLPNAPPPAEPTGPGATAPAAPTAPDPAAASSEPPAPSEYDYAADTDPAALQDFREALSPYGTWEDDATYGVIWVPSSVVVGADFAPYVSHGHWGLGAGNAWMWMSDFSWGWAPFHYGRWIWIGGRGWGWIPGRVYAPAWVVWRTGFYDDYYVGWAPMPPSWYWRRGWAYRLGFYPPAPYVFCSASYIFAPHVRMHIAPPARVNLIAPRTRPYVAASPGVASTGYTPYTMTRGPSMVEANVPKSSIPAERVAPDARAMSFERTRPASRSFATTTQPGAFPGRGDVMPRPSTFPSTPGSSVYPRPLPPTAASMPGPQQYTPRPMTPPSGPMQPVMPATPRPSPVEPSFPRSYSPPSSQFSRPAPFSPAPMMRPSSPSPAPMVRPSAPSVNMARPSMPAPRSVAPAVRAPVSPRIGR